MVRLCGFLYIFNNNPLSLINNRTFSHRFGMMSFFLFIIEILLSAMYTMRPHKYIQPAVVNRKS